MNEKVAFSIDGFNKQMDQPTLHPLMAIIDSSKVGNLKGQSFSGNFYAIYLRQVPCGSTWYGRSHMDFQYGTIVFKSPGEKVLLENVEAESGTTGLLFHPEVFRMEEFVSNKDNYSFFSYKENESLHVSLREKKIVLDCLQHIHKELEHAIDRHTLRLMAVLIRLLLDYCRRFYERQFILRSDYNQSYLNMLDHVSDTYFAQDGHKNLKEGRLYVEQQFHMLSSAYLNDLIQAEIGKTLSEYLQAKMLNLIRTRLEDCQYPISKIAEEFGFPHSRQLEIRFKNMFGCLPKEYRMNQQKQGH